MNVPRLVITPRRLDLDALETQIAEQQLASGDLRVSVQSRTQSMLTDLLEREEVLNAEHKEVRIERSRLNKNIADLQAIEAEYSTVDSDLQLELQAVTSLVALLKGAGVKE